MKSVLVLGGSSDIGLEVASVYHDKGFSVVLHYNTMRDELKDLVRKLDNIKLICLDLSNLSDVENLISDSADIFSNSDVIVNCTGYLEPKEFYEINADHICRTFNINLFAVLLFYKNIIPHMMRREWGRIVNLGSIGVKYGGGKNSFCYAMTKHSLEFFPSEHKTWASKNVFINTLRVGVTDTRIHRIDKTKDMSHRVSLIPAGRMASVSEIAKSVYWFGSEENTFITAQVLAIAGGE